MSDKFKVGDLVTFDSDEPDLFIGVVVKVWMSFAGEYWATVLWNDGDKTVEEAGVNAGVLMPWSEYGDR